MTDAEVEAEIKTMIKDVELVEETAKTAVELSEKLAKDVLTATETQKQA